MISGEHAGPRDPERYRPCCARGVGERTHTPTRISSATRTGRRRCRRSWRSSGSEARGWRAVRRGGCTSGCFLAQAPLTRSEGRGARASPPRRRRSGRALQRCFVGARVVGARARGALARQRGARGGRPGGEFVGTRSALTMSTPSRPTPSEIG